MPDRTGLRTTALLLKVCLIGHIATLVVATASWIALFSVTAPFSSSAGFLGLAFSINSLLLLISFLVCVVLVPVWVHRACSNLHAANLPGLNYSPGWAAASFFVPFVNAIVPMRVLRELHNRSHGEGEFHAAASVDSVTSWWACNWGAFAVFLVAAGYFAVTAIPGVFVLMPPIGWFGLGGMLNLLLAGSAWFLSRIIAQVTTAQSEALHLNQAEIFS